MSSSGNISDLVVAVSGVTSAWVVTAPSAVNIPIYRLKRVSLSKSGAFAEWFRFSEYSSGAAKVMARAPTFRTLDVIPIIVQENDIMTNATHELRKLISVVCCTEAFVSMIPLKAALFFAVNWRHAFSTTCELTLISGLWSAAVIGGGAFE